MTKHHMLKCSNNTQCSNNTMSKNSIIMVKPLKQKPQNYYSSIFEKAWTLNPHYLFPHLRLDISIMVVLKQQSSRLGVIFAGSDVERRQADFTFCVMFQQQRDHLIMTLLQSNGQRSEAILQTQTKDRQRLRKPNQNRPQTGWPICRSKLSPMVRSPYDPPPRLARTCKWTAKWPCKTLNHLMLLAGFIVGMNII